MQRTIVALCIILQTFCVFVSAFVQLTILYTCISMGMLLRETSADISYVSMQGLTLYGQIITIFPTHEMLYKQ